jgi:hypothetical protein
MEARELPDNYRPATSEDVPEGRACGNCMFFDESNVAPDGRCVLHSVGRVCRGRVLLQRLGAVGTWVS